MKNSVKAIVGGTVCFAFTLSPTLADTRYVDINNPTPIAPFTSWGTAANDIQTAVNAATSNDTVLIADGKVKAHADDSDIIMDCTKAEQDEYILKNINSIFSMDCGNVVRMLSEKKPKK